MSDDLQQAQREACAKAAWDRYEQAEGVVLDQARQANPEYRELERQAEAIENDSDLRRTNFKLSLRGFKDARGDNPDVSNVRPFWWDNEAQLFSNYMKLRRAHTEHEGLLDEMGDMRSDYKYYDEDVFKNTREDYQRYQAELRQCRSTDLTR